MGAQILGASCFSFCNSVMIGTRHLMYTDF